MNGILEVTLNGEIKQLKFSNYSLETYTRISGSDIGNIKEIGENYSQLQMVADLIYSGLTGYYRSKSLIIDFSYEDVVEWVDDLNYETQLQVTKCFTESCLKITQEMIKAFKAMSDDKQEKKK
jgi:hypothetical protein